MDLEIVNDPEDGIVAVDRDTGDRVPVPMDELDVKSTYSESVNTEEGFFGDYNEEIFPQAVSGQVVAAGSGIPDEVQYFDATADIAQAINDAWASLSDGGFILLPHGEYSTSTQIQPQGSSVHLKGMGVHHDEGEIDDAVGTRIQYNGTGNGVDLGQLTEKITHLKFEDFALFGTADADVGINLDSASATDGSEAIHRSEFNNVLVEDFGSDGWKFGENVYTVFCNQIYAYSNGGYGVNFTDTVPMVTMTGEVAGNADGAFLQGRTMDVTMNALNNQNNGYEVATVRGGTLRLKAEGNQGGGIRMTGGSGVTLIPNCIHNGRTDDTAYELEIRGGEGISIPSGDIVDDRGRSLRLAFKPRVHFGEEVVIRGDDTEFIRNGGKDISFAAQPPEGVYFDAANTTTTDADGVISGFLDGVFTRMPEVNVNVQGVSGAPSGETLGYWDVSTTTDGDGDVDDVIVTFFWSDGSQVGSNNAGGSVTATIYCSPR